MSGTASHGHRREIEGKMAMWSIRGRLAHVALVTALLCALVTGPAGAQPERGTIVFVRDGDVWMTDTTGSAQVRVTTSGGWTSPSMSDDGIIAAVREGRSIATMDRAGRLITQPFAPPVVLTPGGIVEARINPEGTLIAYWTIGDCQDGSGGVCETTQIVAADGTGGAVGGAVQARYPAWLPDGRIIVHSGLGADVAEVGQFVGERWFPEDDGAGGPDGPRHVDSFSVNREGSLLALNGAYPREGDPASRADGLYFFALPDLPPAQPDLHERCAIVDPAGQSTTGVSIDPFGTDIVFAQGAGSDPLLVERFDLIISDSFDPAVCGGSLRVLARDAEDPFWSAAPFREDAPPSVPPSPDEPRIELTDGARVDGGGAMDPVEQAIATSQSVWGDATASRVVLATSASFADALAGSALAGELGPILVTPFGPDLDPRVEAEIARITGGHGMLFVLGGVNAISESAAAQALAASGNTSCTPPFPADCRYAGTGREHTAALVGQTVLALHGGSGGRALLARGDAFADAITGGAYAAEAGVPILLTPSGSLNATTEEFIRDNDIGEVIVLGGTAAVSEATVAAIPTVTRRIAGDDRTATSAAIATELWLAEGLAGGGIVAVNVRDEQAWPAALAAAVVSAMANAPQLGLENPPAEIHNPGAALLSAAQQLGGPVAAYGSPALVGDDQLAALQEAAGGADG